MFDMLDFDPATVDEAGLIERIESLEKHKCAAAAAQARMTENFNRPVDPNYAPQTAQVNFADGFPLLMISEASLADLNKRLSQPLPMNRFRPNLVVSGCEPFAEDYWQSVRIGNATFQGVKPCQRCIITTIDQTTGISGREPLATLAYRGVKGGVIFGQNLVHTGAGEVRVGNPVEVLSPLSCD